MLDILEQAAHGQTLEALIGAYEQLGRAARRLDGAEPEALRLPLRIAELSGGINLDLDAS
jgi:hypothetical protein